MLTGLNHITIAVSDLEKSFKFYVALLGFKPEVKWDAGAYLTLGNLWLCLSSDKASPAKDYTHIAFSIPETSFTSFSSELAHHGIETWKQNNSEGESLYLLDPDGHKLEIHVGDLKTRLEELKQKPYKGLIWF